MNEENQVYFVDSDKLPQEALARKHRLEQDASFRTNHMEYMEGMQVIDSDIKDKVLAAMDAYDYDSYTAADVERALSHESCTSRTLRHCCHRQQHRIWNRWQGKQRRSRRIILEIRSISSHRFILQTIARTTAFTVASTVITTSAGRS